MRRTAPVKAASGRLRNSLAARCVPLTYSTAPPADLDRVVSRFFVTAIDQDEDAVVDDFLFNESVTIQLPIYGDWSSRAAGGAWRPLHGPTLVGPLGRAVRFRGHGPAMIVGVAIRACGWRAIDSRPAAAVADRIEPVPAEWHAALAGTMDGLPAPAVIVDRLQDVMRDRIARMKISASVKAADFETLVRTESNMPVATAATRLDMNIGTFDRFVRRHFGHAPKIVLRRSRFLDMAGVLHGLAAAEIDAVAEERFYDASHLNREFRLFLDMTPGVFARTHTPLLNAELVARNRIAG